MKKTEEEINKIFKESLSTYKEKEKQYGDCWRLFRTKSINEQIFMKLMRARTILESKGESKVEESWENSIKEALNYCVLGIMLETPFKFSEILSFISSLIIKKNHDYGEAWRKMESENMIDICLVKSARIKHNSDFSLDNFQDIVGYCCFVLLKSKN